MKTTQLIAPLCAIALLTGCQKETTVPLSGTQPVAVSHTSANRSELLSYNALRELLPDGPRATPKEYEFTNSDKTITEVHRVYEVSSSNIVNISVGDFVAAPDELSYFLRGSGILIATGEVAEARGIVVSLVSGSETEASRYGLMLPESSGQGVIKFSTASQGWAPEGLNDLLYTPEAFDIASGSKITAYANSEQPKIAGWQIYDGNEKYACLILTVPDSTGNRIAYLIEEYGASSLDNVNSIAAGIPCDVISRM